ncbi:MAG: Ku protein [Vicinamibacterales bacterium]
MPAWQACVLHDHARMARALWKGSIAFGLVNIPVELHTAVRDSRPRFRLLHGNDHSPVKFERVCVREGKPVAWEELVKGYEYEKGRFVVLTKEDFRAAALEKSRTIDIRSFVKGEEIDDRFFESSYYLLPAKGGERAYALLREAMRDTGLVGVATIVLRDAQHLAALEVADEALVLTQMRYAEELVDASQYSFPPAKDIRKPELQMAETLVKNLAGKWDPERYRDEYRDNLMKIIKAKKKGTSPKLAAHAEPRRAEVVDLMERLRQSLQESGGPAPKSSRARKPKKKTASARKKKAA